MIEKLTIKDVASYDKTGIEMNLNIVNYIYGSNGTGKTTISEFLRNSNKEEKQYSSCNIKWKQENSNLDVFVYNKNFVEENFNINNEIKGIFTLGKESTDLLKKIKEKDEKITQHNDQIYNLENKIYEKEQELGNLQNRFMNDCWQLKLKYDSEFSEAFTGLRNNKKKFMDRFLDEVKTNKNTLYKYDELRNRIEKIFRSTGEKIERIQDIYYDSSIEVHPIFKTKIIGKTDLDISKLITELNISDWVRQGHKHMEESDGVCPFCQQELPENFKEKLNQFFDKTYAEQIENLKLTIETYKNIINNFKNKYNFLLNDDIPYINKEKIVSIFELINSTYKENIKLTESKLKEPSKVIELSSIVKYVNQLKSEVEEANLQISEHNRLIDNLKSEKETLIKDIWRFIIHENKNNYKNYKDDIKKIEKALDGMRTRKQKLKEYKRKFEEELTELQNQLTSVLPSINEINRLLSSVGFTNFKLAESNEEGYYRIIRENGEDANETLSEGEKTFITFLYFYQLINGSNIKTNVNTPRVIVIDDPISSLDSDILFIVSNIINELKNRIRSNNSIFKQLIIFTHNVYFYKEITFNKKQGNKRLQDESFWILRKTDNITSITQYPENPIRNSYELLWRELKENTNSITLPNIMRRILENYFKFFGNIYPEQIIETFEDEDKIVCNSLLSWVNDGSHHVNDDLYVDSNPELINKYLEVFERIFKNSGHYSHFEMMMGDFQFGVSTENETAVEEIKLAKQQAASNKTKK